MQQPIAFITGNKHKFKEVHPLFMELGIVLDHLNIDKPEIRNENVPEIAKAAAKQLAEEHGRAVIVDDTGILFHAYHNFPGPYPKFVFDAIGYKGIFRLLEGQNRGMSFLCAAAYCAPGEKPVVFEGTCDGEITTSVRCINMDVMPYERIFMPKGYDKVWAEIPHVKKQISHRVKAFRELAGYLERKKYGEP